MIYSVDTMEHYLHMDRLVQARHILCLDRCMTVSVVASFHGQSGMSSDI
jgi:hypothetical protein